MGGTYIDTEFKDRHSENPNRRRLIPVLGDDNLYDVIREEGNVYNPGTPFNAQTMNTFNKHISDMFPVSPVNGGTGERSITAFLDKYNLISYVKSYDNNPNYFNLSSLDNKSKFKSTYHQGMCYIFNKFCLMSICIVSECTSFFDSKEKYLCIKDLPYKAYYNKQNVAGESRFIYMTCPISTYRMVGNKKEYGDFLIDADNKNPKYTVAYLDPETNIIYLQEATAKNRIYINAGTHININLACTYYIE